MAGELDASLEESLDLNVLCSTSQCFKAPAWEEMVFLSIDPSKRVRARFACHACKLEAELQETLEQKIEKHRDLLRKLNGSSGRLPRPDRVFFEFKVWG